MKKSRNGKFTIYEENDKCALDEYSEVLAEELENEFENNDETVKGLKQKNTEQDTTIEELKAENERLNNDINAISVTERAEGENITLNDTADGARFKKFGIGGNSWQETRSGKNVLKNNLTTQTINGVTATVNEDESVTLNGTATAKTVFYLIQNGIDILKANTSYTLSKSNASISNIILQLCLSAEGLSNIYKSAGTTNNTFSLTEDRNINYCAIIIESGTTINNITVYPQLERDTTATDYEQYGTMPSTEFESPIQNVTGNANIKITNNLESTDENYKEKSFTFPLAEGQKLMLGDYLADDGIHHKRGQYIITGEENLTLNKENETIRRFAIDNILPTNCKFNDRNVYAMSNYFKGASANDTQTKSNTISVRNRAGFMISFDVTDDRFSTAEKVKNMLAELYANGLPAILEYELAEEIIEPYTEEQQEVYDEIKKTAHSYGEQTHIFSTDEISPIFNVEARKDMNTVVSNIESMILANASEEV